MNRNSFESRLGVAGILMLLSPLLAPTTGFAAEPGEYRVEMLMLRHLNNEGRSFEAPPVAEIPQFGDAASSQAPSEQRRRVRYRNVPWTEFRMKGENSRLRRSRDFRPLVHLGWTQAALETERSGWVPVRGRADDGTLISGQARLSVNRYLHLHLELDADIPDKGTFQLRDSRRMKSSEVHYFDHPEFGVLVTVIPEPAAKEPEPAPSADETPP